MKISISLGLPGPKKKKPKPLVKPVFYDLIFADLPTARSTIRKLRKHFEAWKPVEFTPTELKWLHALPTPKTPKATIYRGMSVKTSELDAFPRTAFTFKPKGQNSSWTESKNKTDYFQRGTGIPIVLKATLPTATKYFYMTNFFKLAEELESYFRKVGIVALTNAEVAVYDLIDCQHYDEKEVLVFGPIKSIRVS